MSVITVERKVLEKNDEIAAENFDLLKRNKVFTLNLISSPGSGKTSILEQTARHLGPSIKLAVIEGDVQTSLDAERIDQLGVPVVQIITNGGCHLDAGLVRDSLENFNDLDFDLLFIENVGNLICPASYKLGEDSKVIVISTTEGDDKPLKYPAIFRFADVMIINKTDLLPYLDSSADTMRKNALSINPGLKVFSISCKTGEGIPEWCDWLMSNLKRNH